MENLSQRMENVLAVLETYEYTRQSNIRTKYVSGRFRNANIR